MPFPGMNNQVAQLYNQEKQDKMKKTIFSLMSVVMLLGIASCSDDEVVKNHVQPGEVVRFSIDQRASRTVYETEDEWQIDWIKGDGITIFCQQAEGAKSADYTITPTNADHSVEQETPSKYGLVDDNENGLCWNGAIINENPAHNFYAVYPAGVATSCGDDGIVTLPLKNSQVCTIKNTPTDGKYVAEPDMSNAYMVAAATGIQATSIKSSTTSAEGTIDLVFAPVMTTLEVEVSCDGTDSNPNDANTLGDVSVTGITILMPSVPRTSDNKFRYQINTNSMTTAKNNGAIISSGDGISSSAESYFVGLRYNGGNSLTLSPGESVKFTAFLPPVEINQENQIRIRVNASGNVNYTVTIGNNAIEGQTGQKIAPSSKRKIKLPVIDVSPTEGEEVTSNNWISLLDDDIYVNQLSIPGTNNSAAYDGYRDRAISQTANIDAQWNAGVRAFEFRSAVTTGLSAIGNSGANERYVNCYDGGYNTGLMLKDALTLVHNKVKGTDEFAIVVCSYQAENLASIGINRLYKYYWYANRRYALFTQYNGMPDAMSGKTEGTGENDWFVPFKPDLTVGECRGKIILINFDEYQNYVGVLVDGAESTDEAETVIETSKNGVDFKSTGSWHTMSKNGTKFDGKIYIQNAFYSAYGNNQTHADKQSYIKAADDEAVKLHTQDTHNWVLNYVGGANSQTTDDYQLAAAANNKFFNDWLIGNTINGKTRAEGPTGIVMVSHQGVQKTSNGTSVYGENLPQTIINNNFKFRMQRKGGK